MPKPNTGNIEHKAYPILDLKTDDQSGQLEAIVSVFSNTDAGFEKVMPGSFTKSIQRKLPKGVWAHDWKQPIAKTIEARELPAGDPLLPDSLKELGGAYIKGQFNLDTQRGREAYSDIKFGIIDEFSIGYKVLRESKDKETGARELLDLDWKEWSPVLVGMNDQTRLISIKDEEGGDPTTPVLTKEEKIEVKKAIGASGLPLAGRDVAWDASAADKAVRKWAGAEGSPNAKYAKAFFFVSDDGGDAFGDFKLGFADIVDGKLTAIPKGIFAVAGALQGARGGIDIPDADKSAIKTKVSAYYKQIATAEDDDAIIAPWDKDTSKADATECVCCADDSLDCGCTSKEGGACSCHADCPECMDNECEGLAAAGKSSAAEVSLESLAASVKRLEEELRLAIAGKAGAVNSAGDIKKIKSIHDTAVSMEPSMCSSGDEKAGARNSASMKKHLTAIHDATAMMEKSVCPSQEKALKVREQAVDLFRKSLMGVMGIKGIYEDALAELTAASPYQILYAFLNTIQQIDDLEDASEGSAFTPDTEGLVREAAAAAMNDLVTWALAKLAEDVEDYPYPYSYYAAPPTDFKELSSGLVTEPFDVHQLAVVTAVKEVAQRSSVIQKAMTVFINRAKEKQEFRNGADGRPVSSLARVRKSEMDEELAEAQKEIATTIETSKSLAFVEPEDLTAQAAKQRLQFERLRTNAQAN